MKFLQSILNRTKYFGLRRAYYLGRSLALASYKIIVNVYQSLIDFGLVRRERQQSLIKRRISRVLAEEFGGDEGHNIDRKQYFLGFGLIHYSLIRNLRPKNILCVGSREGFIPAILALACKDNGIGHVDLVDAGYDSQTPEKQWGGIGFWKKHDAKEHFGKIGLSNLITTYVMTTEEFAKKYPQKTYGYIFIDGDHSYEGVSLDYKLFWPRLKKDGLMLFHDIVARGYLNKGRFGVWKFWQELGDKGKITFPFPQESGLGIIQKQE